jgi:toxin YoeB
VILKWAEQAWEDYLYWQQTDKKITKRINKLIEHIKRHPFEGLGNPEPLKYNTSSVGKLFKFFRIIFL